MKPLLHSMVFLVIGLAYWQIACLLSNVSEPWDAPNYWVIEYPLSLLLSGATGLLIGRTGRFAGLMFTLAQLPILISVAGFDSLVFAGFLLLLGLSVPALGISAFCAYIAERRRSAIPG